jgi:hypothetical protein
MCYSCLCVFIFHPFSNVSKTVLNLVVYAFVENFKRYHLIIKRALIAEIMEKKFLECWEAHSFWDTRYIYTGCTKNNLAKNKSVHFHHILTKCAKLFAESEIEFQVFINEQNIYWHRLKLLSSTSKRKVYIFLPKINDRFWDSAIQFKFLMLNFLNF